MAGIPVRVRSAAWPLLAIVGWSLGCGIGGPTESPPTEEAHPEVEVEAPTRALRVTWSEGTLHRPAATLAPAEDGPDIPGTCLFALGADRESGEPTLSATCEIRGLIDLQVDGAEEVLDDSHRKPREVARVQFRGDLTRHAAATPLDELTRPAPKLDLALPVTFQVAGYQPVSSPLPELALPGPVLTGLAARGMPFVAEPPDDGKRSALLVRKGFTGVVLLGEGETLGDLDWLIVQTDVETDRTTKCSVSGLGTFTLVANDAQLEIHDRRTGELVKQETLEHGSLQCSKVKARSGRSAQVTSSVGAPQVRAWAEKQLASGG